MIDVKITFDTQATGTDTQDNATQLLIECGTNDLIIVWYKKNPTEVCRIKSYQFSGEVSEKVNQLEHILSALRDLNLETEIVYNNIESMLIPESYDRVYTRNALMDLFFGEERATIQQETCSKEQAVVLYRMSDEVNRMFQHYFPHAGIKHATPEQVAYFEDGITCMLHHQLIKIIVKNEAQLQLVQYYEYHSPSDAAYHLLNICDSYKLDRSTIHLYLTGMIHRDSNLYREFEKYFLNIEPVRTSITLPESISEEAAHYFTHLMPFIES